MVWYRSWPAVSLHTDRGNSQFYMMWPHFRIFIILLKSTGKAHFYHWQNIKMYMCDKCVNHYCIVVSYCLEDLFTHHICTRTLMPSTCNVLILKSTPKKVSKIKFCKQTCIPLGCIFYPSSPSPYCWILYLPPVCHSELVPSCIFILHFSITGLEFYRSLRV